MLRVRADRARSFLGEFNFLKLRAVVQVFLADDVLHDLPLLVPAVHVVLEVLLRAYCCSLVGIEVPFDLMVLLRDFIHEYREGHPGRLVLAPGELNLTGSVGRRHWPFTVSEVGRRGAHGGDQLLFASLQPVGSMEGHRSVIGRLMLLCLFACLILNASGSAEVTLGAATKSNVLRMIKVPPLLDLLLEACLQLFILFNKDLLYETLLVVCVELDPLDELSNVLDCLSIH